MMTRGGAASLAVALGAAWTAPAALNLATTARGHRHARRRLRDTSQVALTFDDGPQPGATRDMLELLSREDVRATFFVVAQHALEHGDIVRDMVAEGHAVQCHGHRHRNHLLRNPLGIVEDMARSQREIARLTGSVPTLFRPPQGVVTWPTLVAMRRHFDALVLWSSWGRDWRKQATPATITDEVAGSVRGGDIMLLHDADWYGAGSARSTQDATRLVIERVRDSGKSFTTLTGVGQLA